MTRWGYMLVEHESGIDLPAAIADHPTHAPPDIAPVMARWDPATKAFRVDWRLLEQLRRLSIEPVLYAETDALAPTDITLGKVDDAIRLMAARARGALIRLLNEGNGALFGWGSWPAPLYIDVYRRMARLCHEEGARTIYSMAHRGRRGDDLLERWPGDDAADVTGFTEFRRSDEERPPVLQWAYAADVLGRLGKPVWVTETGAEASTSARAKWLSSLAEVDEIGIAAVLIFDRLIRFPFKDQILEDDWRWSPAMRVAWDGLPR